MKTIEVYLKLKMRSNDKRDVRVIDLSSNISKRESKEFEQSEDNNSSSIYAKIQTKLNNVDDQSIASNNWENELRK